MDNMQLTAWSVFAIACCNVLVLIGLGVVVMKLIGVLKTIEQKSDPAIQAAKTSLAKVQTLTETAQNIVEHNVTPILNSVKETTHAVNQTVEGVRRTAGRVEDAVAKPIRLLTTAGNALETPAGKAGLLALGMGVARYTVARKQKQMERQAIVTDTRTNGHTARTNGATASAN